MKYFKIILCSGLMVAMGVMTGCRKYLDVNNNPNITTTTNPELLLPSAQVGIAVAMGVDLQTNGNFWSQYWTQSPAASQYKGLDQYQPSGSDYDREWAQFYSGALMDLKKLQEIANEQKKPQYVAIAKLLMAYSFQVITDVWGDVPFNDALKGEISSGVVLNPQYDRQAQIYDSLIAMTDEALALINTADTKKPTTDDLVFGGNMTSWRKFGNTLKLKLYMRLSEVNPAKAQAGIAALMNGGAVFMDGTDNAQVNFYATSGNRNPLAGEITALNYVQNQVASATAIDSLKRNNDPRIEVFYESAFDAICNDLGFIGLKQGNYNASASLRISAPGAITGGNADINCTQSTVAARRAPVRFLMGYESLFLQAEAVARNYGTAGETAESLFKRAIKANFSYLGLTDAEANAYIAGSSWGQYPVSGSLAAQVKQIITQKWFSMTGIQGIEAWTEQRRTGYPDFLKPSVNSFLGNDFPARFPYPNTELTRNAKFPGQKRITEKVYWDVN
jgi:hypothetical protein